MKTRGRNSSAAATIVAGNFGERPEPPADLTKRQIAIWREVVASEDPDFFNSAVLRGLLADYCRRRAVCEEITNVIDGFGASWKRGVGDLEEYDLLLRMRDREQKGVIELATKLRLTNQSRWQPQGAARAATKAAAEQDIPWRKSA